MLMLTWLSAHLAQSIPSTLSASSYLKTGISKLAKFGEWTDADLDVKTFRHQQLRRQVLNRPKQANQDRRILTRARVVTHLDIVRLRGE